MSTKKFTCKEALGLLFANPDSEGENLPSEDDGPLVPALVATRSHPRPCVTSSRTKCFPTPNTIFRSFAQYVGGEENVSRGRSLHQGVSRRGSTGGNEAGSNVGVLSF